MNLGGCNGEQHHSDLYLLDMCQWTPPGEDYLQAPPPLPANEAPAEIGKLSLRTCHCSVFNFLTRHLVWPLPRKLKAMRR